MTDPAKSPPILIADHPALDFLNTVGAPHGTDIEWLGDGRSLITWMVAAGILSEAQASKATGDLSCGWIWMKQPGGLESFASGSASWSSGRTAAPNGNSPPRTARWSTP